MRQNKYFITFSFVLICALFTFSITFGQTTIKGQKALSSREIVKKVSKSLVLIVTQGKNGEALAQGSGFIYQENVIATTLHIFKRASQGYVKVLDTGVSHKINEIIAIDIEHDLCLLQVPGVSGPSLPLSSLSNIAVGDEIYIGGNPKGLEGSFSKGIISSIRLKQGVIQIDAAISPGSSGGPVVNNHAEVIGIAALTLPGGQNLNFAIPISYLTALPTNWNAPVIVVGALSLTDKEVDKLNGPVKSVIVKEAKYSHDDNYFLRTGRFSYVEGPAELQRIIKYNHEGNTIEWENYLFGIKFKIIKEYNRQGIPIRTVMIDANGKETVKFLDEIEGIKLKIEGRNFDQTTRMTAPRKDTGEKIVINERTYDSYGNITEEIMDIGDGPLKSVYTYDRNGNEIEQHVYKNEKLEDAFRYTYEFDEWKNWIKKKGIYYNSKYDNLGYIPSSVTYREIIYYED